MPKLAKMPSSPIELGMFASRMAAVCEEMGANLQHAAFSPNIKDRLDFSCAIFGPTGELCAQAAHIPVHLGSMAFAMRRIVEEVDWAEGDMLVLNDPFLGGTHLPDVTMVAPLFIVCQEKGNSQLAGFVANRAHHANIGADSPGSMPLSSRLSEEGIIIPPSYIIRQHEIQSAVLYMLVGEGQLDNEEEGLDLSDARLGDFSAQVSANRIGVGRLSALIEGVDIDTYLRNLDELDHYAERIAASVLEAIPDGQYGFQDVMDDDGQGQKMVLINVEVIVSGDEVVVDFGGSAKQVAGNINCPLSVAAAAVYYVFRCLMPDYTPACFGAFRKIKIEAPLGCFLNAERPAAVVAGNVETSSRIVDAVLGALAKAIPEQIPAASHGSMNNVAMGVLGEWDYYETIGGGMGAHGKSSGISGVQTHMTNTLNTPIESLETHYPLRVRRYGYREHSGGEGLFNGGDGIVREFEFLSEASVTLLTERRVRSPWGLEMGGHGEAGVNKINGKVLPGKVQLNVKKGDRLCIETPGGGGFGKK
ncbi:MAG: hydantoinase B/oxoprolinase family protein [Pseudomonadales bacterium]|nr:hydantoinase B/oxoprolinase family protein [Pseudomonadales bacterium]